MRPQPRGAAYRELVARYEAYRLARGYVPGGARTDAQYVGQFLAWVEARGVREVEAITAEDVAAYWRELATRPKGGGGTLAEGSQRHRRRAVRGALAMLHHAGELASDPSSGVRHGRSAEGEATEVPALTQSEVAALYAASESQVERAVLGLGYGCGLRVSEAAALDVGAVRFGSGGGRLAAGAVTVERGKGGRRRVVPLSAGVREDLADYYYGERVELEELSGRQQAALVLNVRGERMQAWTYNKVLGRLIGRAIDEGRMGAEVLGKRTSFHGLRHAIATHLLERGLSLEQVRLFLGHAHLETTEVYTHVSAELLGELVPS